MTSSENKYNVWIYCILIISASLAAFHVVSNIKISPDAMRFGLVSEQILSGNGISVPLIRLEDNYVPVNGAIPFLDQLPFIPILFALMGGFTAENYLPGQILNFAGHVAIAIFTFLLMKQLCGRRSIALLTGILVSFSYPLLSATHHISSEPIFIALTVGAIYFLVLSRNARYGRYILIATICASTSILTRNAGIAVVPVFFWFVFVLIKNKRLEVKYLSSILAIALPVITVMTLFLRNYMVSGSLRGFNQASPERSLLEAATGTLDMIFQQFHLGGNAVILINLLIALLVLSVLISADLRNRLLRNISEGLDLVIVFLVSYTSLICITMATQQWRFELRYMYPLVPFLYILCNLVIVAIWDAVGSTKLKTISLAGMILSFGLIAFGSCYKTFVNLHEFSYKQDKAYFILSSCTFEWIKENVDTDALIVTNRPFHLSFFGGYSTVALPHKRFNPMIKVPGDMEEVLPERMSKFGAQVVALFEEADERYEGRYIAGLFNKRGNNDALALAYECPDGVVYYLKE